MADTPIPKDVVDRQMALLDMRPVAEELAKAVLELPGWAENERALDLAAQVLVLAKKAGP